VNPPHESPATLPPFLTDVIAEATGQQHRDNVALPRTGGPAGNARLTAWTGLLLLLLFVAELFTLFNVQGLITWHVVLGVLLVPPALVKTASTGWRMINYYRHEPVYVRAGPPPMLLRILGPVVVLTTLAVLGSGLLLIALGPGSSRTQIVTFVGQRVDFVTLHQGFFILWGVATGLHVLGRLVPAVQLAILHRRDSPVAGRGARATLLIATVLAAVGAAALISTAIGSWGHGHRDYRLGDRGHVAASLPR
jgi:cytochrome c oxidase subunit IV